MVRTTAGIGFKNRSLGGIQYSERPAVSKPKLERESLKRNIVSEAVSGLASFGHYCDKVLLKSEIGARKGTAVIGAAGLISAVYLPVLLPVAVFAMCFHIFTVVYKVWYFR